jgi:hypothetical protein
MIRSKPTRIPAANLQTEPSRWTTYYVKLCIVLSHDLFHYTLDRTLTATNSCSVPFRSAPSYQSPRRGLVGPWVSGPQIPPSRPDARLGPGRGTCEKRAPNPEKQRILLCEGLAQVSWVEGGPSLNAGIPSKHSGSVHPLLHLIFPSASLPIHPSVHYIRPSSVALPLSPCFLR